MHVDRDEKSAKFWLRAINLARNFGFSLAEVGRVQFIIREHQLELLEAWDERFRA